MPSLTTVALDKSNAFKHKKTVHTKSIYSSSPSFLDITPALQYYLSFPLSFTHSHQFHTPKQTSSSPKTITLHLNENPSLKQQETTVLLQP